MQLSTYIKELTNLLSTEGNIIVMRNTHGGIIEAPKPCVRYTQKLIGKQSIQRYWGILENNEKLKGEKVISI